MSLDQEVLRFVSNESNEPQSKLTLQTRIWHDLRIGGDDACEFVTKFGKEFGVDISSVVLSRYFPAETAVVLSSFAEYFARLFAVFPGSSYRQLTIGDLVHFAEAGEWMPENAKEEGNL